MPGRLFYGWVILGAAFLISMMGIGLIFSLGVFLPPIEDSFGWGRSAISATALVNWIVFGVFSFLSGLASDRIGSRAVVLTGGGLLGAGILLASRTTEVWHLYLSFGLLGGVGISAFLVPLTSTAIRWFTAQRGLAVSLVSAGSGLGTLVISPLVRVLISALGWRTTFVVLGLLTWAIVVPAALLLRNRPEDLRTTAYGGVPPESRAGITSREALQSRRFWLIALTHFLCCSAHSGPILHMVAYAMDLGIPKLTAAALLGWSGATSIVGRIGSGVGADRYGAKATLVMVLALQAAVVGSYALAHHVFSLYLVTAFFGIAYGGVMPLYALLAREYFGDRIMGTAYGAIFFVSSLGMGLGSYAGGWVFDLLGNYRPLYLAGMVVALGAAGLAAGLPAARVPRT